MIHRAVGTERNVLPLRNAEDTMFILSVSASARIFSSKAGVKGDYHPVLI